MEWRNVMAGFASLAILAAGVLSARAETPLERGTYLMRGIVACGNCHTPKGPQGDLTGMELAGGVTFQEDVFTAVSPNITPDAETGIGRIASSADHCFRVVTRIKPCGAIVRERFDRCRNSRITTTS